MRRTGKSCEPPATGIVACVGAMTNEALMMDLARKEKGRLSGAAGQRQRANVTVLQAEERSVAAVAAEQVVVAAGLDHLAAFDDVNGIGMHDGLQAVRDHQRRATLAQM